MLPRCSGIPLRLQVPSSTARRAGTRSDIPLPMWMSRPGRLIPAFGIYACWAVVNGEKHPAAQLASGQLHGARAARSRPAAISIGIRPTFDEQKPDVRVEAYLLDYDADLYGQTVTLEFVKRLRDELKFPSVDALIAQIELDVQNVRTLLK